MRQYTRAGSILENFDDIITGLMTTMDDYASKQGGYISQIQPGNWRTRLDSDNYVDEQEKSRATVVGKTPGIRKGIRRAGIGTAAVGAGYLANRAGLLNKAIDSPLARKAYKAVKTAKDYYSGS